MTKLANRRILLVDDLPSIHNDFHKILGGYSHSSDFDTDEALLFGVSAPIRAVDFELDSAYQGREALTMIEAAVANGTPYALAFVDMRMPPGWDGIETIEQLWKADPWLQIVICTAYSDHSWAEVLERLDVRDRLLILKKPFDNIEVCQLASTLTGKWSTERQATLQMAGLEEAVRVRTSEILRINEALRAEMNERKSLEIQLVQSEKLASIGHLAAGVAHEINNPIGFVLSNFGTLDRYIEDLFTVLAAYEKTQPDALATHIAHELANLRERVGLAYMKEDIPVLMRESKEGVTRVQQIVQNLRDFSRGDSRQEWQVANLHDGIDSTLNILANEIKYKADLVKEYGVLPAVECLPAQLNQVVMNLVLNAVQAIGTQRGRITIRTGIEAAQAWIEVADTGSGISPDILARIFDPFFTTKPIGQGTGLGLSLSYGIMQKHQGQISVNSAVGRGTTFRLQLPIQRGAFSESK
ncbi:hybrid sensor histidine kinase/response regulator [Duganella sp. BJB488]|uniref:ATP-binding protein n=1 Tax=unclassified Duganella TaxID=2636909 RepID=UPI000E341268|nr:MULTISPECIES: ATP-binding protein [unclassified Duganella]RFP10948.1 hybrid sensor histidine kinase/response regulator [Duganella sp. BJB489]RFP14503.1 hybrid sensor histidine kinase/response regulator [Duganella sp. BJB488]RFP30439.1 hybrid sensor histidine kinase/response regulator [Duganella sp. BJB480]